MNTPIDTYLEAASDTQLARASEIRAIVTKRFGDDVEECLSYAMPGFRLISQGKVVLGFALNKHSIGVYPHSGGALLGVKSDLSQYKTAKSALNFPLDTPIPEHIINELLEARLAEILG